MSWPTIVLVIIVAAVISLVAAAIGYYLQVQLRRLREVEEDEITSDLESPLPSELEASLVVVKGINQGEEFKLSSENTIIGRSEELCDIVVADKLVSERHARIGFEGDNFYIYDLASTNGTWVNGAAIVRALLQDGDRVRIGNTELEFRYAQTEAGVPSGLTRG